MSIIGIATTTKKVLVSFAFRNLSISATVIIIAHLVLVKFRLGGLNFINPWDWWTFISVLGIMWLIISLIIFKVEVSIKNMEQKHNKHDIGLW